MHQSLTRIATTLAAAACAMTASAADVNMTGWQTWGGITATANSSTTVAVPSGVTGVSSMSFANLNFDALGYSWRSEFLIRVEVPGSAASFWTLKPASENSSGNWQGSADATSCTYAGGPFTFPAGTTSIKVFVYESYNDGGDTTQDAQVNGGTLTINFGNPPPPVDPCAAPLNGVVGVNNLTLNGTAASLEGVTCGATTIYKANYVKFIAPETRRYSVDTCAASSGDTVLAALTQCGNAATQVACNDDSCGLRSSINIDATAGTTYYIAVGGYSSSSTLPSPMPVTITPAAPPFDACANPPVATVGTNTLPMNSGAADLDIYWAGVVVYKCNYLKFTPTQDGIFTVSNCADESFDSWIIRATECGNADAVIDGNDDGCGIFAGPSSLQFSGTAGTTYYIGIGGYSAGTQLPTESTVVIDAQYCTSGFDACKEAVTVSVGSTPIELDCGAQNLDLTGYWTPEFGDPAIGQANYVRFVAPTTDQYEAALCAVAEDQRLAVLTVCGDGSTLIAADDDGCTGGAPPYNSKVSWPATAGTTYYIAVGSYIQGGESFTISADQVIDIGAVAPPADPCAPENVVTATVGNSYVVIPDPAFPDLDMNGSACVFPFNPQTISRPKYLKLTPTVSGQHTLSNCTDAGSTVDCRIACLASCGDAATTIACDDDGCTGGAPYTSRLTVDLVAGVSYYFAVGGYSSGATGPFNILVEGPSGPPPCFGDLNLDGVVNGGDLSLLLGNWGNSGIGDLNNDGVVNGADIALLLGAWGACP